MDIFLTVICVLGSLIGGAAIDELIRGIIQYRKHIKEEKKSKTITDQMVLDMWNEIKGMKNEDDR